MRYEWDETKAARNLEIHRVPFGLVRDFDWDTAVIRPDARQHYAEARFAAHGLIGGRLYCLVFTPRGEALRVISLRKANRREVRSYAEKTNSAE